MDLNMKLQELKMKREKLVADKENTTKQIVRDEMNLANLQKEKDTILAKLLELGVDANVEDLAVVRQKALDNIADIENKIDAILNIGNSNMVL